MSSKLGLDEFIEKGGIYYNLPGASAAEAIAAMVKTVRLPKSVDRAALKNALLERESLASTAIGEGIAIPHPRSMVFKDPQEARVALCFTERPIHWDDSDGQPVSTVFLILSADAATHLETLSTISRLAGSTEFHAFLAKRPSTEELVDYLRKPVATR